MNDDNDRKKEPKKKKKGKPPIKISSIHKNEPYSPEMFCKEFDRSIDTLKQYEKEGLNIIYTSEGSYFWGHEFYRFLKEKKLKRKTSKGKSLEQFRCVRCRKLLTVIKNQIVVKPGKKYWVKSNTRQLILVGLCTECRKKVYQFSSTNYLKKINQVFQIVKSLN